MSRELPIFPLPLVLFPGATHALHIFEPRYRRLLTDCLVGDRSFGIAYAAADPARADWDPEPARGDVGCVAVIGSTQSLPDGRSNIMVQGDRRFVLRDWVKRDHPYRIAVVEEFDDDPGDEVETEPLARAVREHYARLAAAVGEESRDLPADFERLSFRVAAVIAVEPQILQRLLSLRSTVARLRQLAMLLRPLAAQAERHAAMRERARGNGRGRARPRPEATT